MSGADALARADQPLRAGLWMVGALVSFSLMAVAGRELAGTASTFQIMFWRSLVGLIIVYVAILIAGGGLRRRIRTNHGALHLFRNIAHFTGQNCWLYAIALIPLAEVFAYEFTTPIWIAILAPIFLAERFTQTRAISALFGFVGVLIVAQPTATGLGLGQIVALTAAIGFAGSIMATKTLTRSDSVWTILFWMTLSQMAMSLIAVLLYDPENIAPRDGVAAMWMIAIGFCGLGAHLCVTQALAHAPATLIAPIDFFRLPLIALIGAALYAEPLSGAVLLGGALVFLGNFINLNAEHRHGRERNGA